jgi:acetoin utilization deacetylase AcuC-like enzyme
MAGTLEVVWDDALAAYDFGPGHPLAPVRLELTMALARELGVFDAPGVSVTVPEPASHELLELQHDPAYIAAVQCAGPMARHRASHHARLSHPAHPRYPGTPAGTSTTTPQQPDRRVPTGPGWPPEPPPSRRGPSPATDIPSSRTTSCRPDN